MKFIFPLLALLVVIGCESADESSRKATEATGQFSDLKLNQIQVLGTHNSYVQPIDSNVMNYVSNLIEAKLEERRAKMSEEELAKSKEFHPNEVSMREALSYSHPPLSEQLDAGMRSLELDVFFDSTGGRFSRPAAYDVMAEQGITNLLPHDTAGLGQPGFKVLHVADFDFRSHCPTFQGCLQELRNWSDANPDHVPVFILLEIKQSGFSMFPNSTEVLTYTAAAMDALDAELVNELGRDKLITPDDIRGDFETLEEAVLAHNYPRVEDSRGKFVFLMLPTSNEEMASPYWQDRPSLEGRMMFVRSTPGTPRSAFLLLDNSKARQEEIKERVQQGYLVRTRADIETYEAKVNDHTRADAAFESGAHIISTDFFKAGNPYGTDYIVEMPGKEEARCNPVIGDCEHE